jgi:hypothetical protein
MKTATQTTFAERLVRTLGQVWRIYERLEQRANGWLVVRGWASDSTKAVLTIIKLALLGLLFNTAFWLALLIMCTLAAAWVAKQSDTENEADFLGRKAEECDHREGLFYHPASYTDDPDPRFEDD